LCKHGECCRIDIRRPHTTLFLSSRRLSAATDPIVMSVKKSSVAASAKPSTAGKAVKAAEGKGKEGKDSKGKRGKAGKEKAGKGKGASKATPRRTSSSGSGAAGAAGAATAGHSHHADEGEFMDQEGLDLQVREKET
jgi:hypothetical protein